MTVIAESARPVETPRGTGWSAALRVGGVLGTAVLLGCVAVWVVAARSWPLVNDAALMHYVVLLMGRGMAPYREIGDINLPWAYVPEWLSMTSARVLHVPDARMWRVFDVGALLLAGLAMGRICGRRQWFAAMFAGCLFALLHGRDGIGQAGQRDLWMAVLLLWAVALMFGATRLEWLARADGVARLARADGVVGGVGWRLVGFGVLVGVAACIKPFALAYLLAATPLLARSRGLAARLRLAGAVVAGVALPVLAAGVFLWWWGAFAGMGRVLMVDLPYHRGLGYAPLGHLLDTSTIWSLRKLGLLAAMGAGLAFLRERQRRAAQPEEYAAGMAVGAAGQPEGYAAGVAGGAVERWVLVGCVAAGVLSYLLQGKGYPYQRYPYEAFVLVLVAGELERAVRSRWWVLRGVGLAGFVFGVGMVAPAFLRGATHAGWSTPVTSAMERAIAEEAGPGGLPSLDGQVQCIDAVTGCTDALLHLGLRQATGQMYDEYLFPETPGRPGVVYTGPEPRGALPRAVELAQGRFQAELVQRAPRVIVVSAWLFPQGPGECGKLALWPWFAEYLQGHYRLKTEQRFATAENGPMGFRLYVRR